MKHIFIKHPRAEYKLRKMELQEKDYCQERKMNSGFCRNGSSVQEITPDINSQGKKDKDYPNTYLETRSEPVERNQGMRIGDVDNHPDNNDKLWGRNKYGFPRGLEIK